MIPFVDIHTHKKYKNTNEIIFVRNAYASISAEFLEKCGYFFSYSVHPWFLSKNIKSETEIQLIFENENLLFVGECGFDRLIETDISIQKNIFENQIELAHKYNKPMMFHLVKSFDIIIQYLPSIKVPVVFHDYLMKEDWHNKFSSFENVYFSLGKNFLRNPEMYKVISFEKLFFETDTMNIPIQELYEKYANINSLNSHFLKEQLLNNFYKIINI